MKKLIEKKNSLLDEMEGILEKAKAETRAFTDLEDARVEEIKKEIRGLEKIIANEEEMRSFDKGIESKAEGGNEIKEVRNYNAEVRDAIELGKELDITNFEVEERGISFGPAPGQATKNIGNIAKKTFAASILEKATDKHTLFGRIRHEAMTAATHQIPVQKDVIGEFLSVAELADYQKKNFDFNVVNLGAYKYGNVCVLSHEALTDTNYNIMGQLLSQYQNSLSATLEKLVVKGEAQIEGLESFQEAQGAHKVTIQQGDLAAGTWTDEDAVILIEKLYRKLPMKYRANATFVLSQDLVDALSFAKDANGRLLISYDYSQVPMGGKPQMYLLGCPVVASPYVIAATGGQNGNKIAFFGDLKKAMIGSLRQSFTIKTSNEVGFMNDSTHVKATVRCDVKRGLAEAMAFVEVTM